LAQAAHPKKIKSGGIKKKPHGMSEAFLIFIISVCASPQIHQ
jgi:hypothetical protein